MSERRRYQPISCSLHDQLEAAATTGRSMNVTYRTDDGAQVTVESGIVDVFNRSGVEYLALADGGEIRLDDLVSVRESA